MKVTKKNEGIGREEGRRKDMPEQPTNNKPAEGERGNTEKSGRPARTTTNANKDNEGRH